MKKILAVALLCITFLASEGIAFAEEAPCDCETRGIIGAPPLGKLMLGGIGYKSFNTLPGCNKAIGLALTIGSESSTALIFGFGYDMGLINLGVMIRGQEKTRGIGFGFGYDYSGCVFYFPWE